jgi:hypothetical protein
MKYLFVVLIFAFYVPLSAQSSEQAEDTIWIEPFLASFKIVLSNAEQVDFVLLEPKYANEIYDLPNGIYIARSISEIESYAKENQIVYYVCLSSFKVDSYTAQIEWRNMSAYCRDGMYQIDYETHVICSFIYHYDGTSWSSGPSSIQTISHSHHNKRE